MIFAYENLRLIWWLLLGVLLIGFAVMDGFDLGAAALLPFVGRTDMERRIVLNTMGPVWEGSPRRNHGVGEVEIMPPGFM